MIAMSLYVCYCHTQDAEHSHTGTQLSSTNSSTSSSSVCLSSLVIFQLISNWYCWICLHCFFHYNNSNNNNNTNICKSHIVSIRAESEAPEGHLGCKKLSVGLPVIVIWLELHANVICCWKAHENTLLDSWKKPWNLYFQNLSILTVIFPGEPGLASFIGAKDNGSGADNWSYKTCKASVRSSPQQTNTVELIPGVFGFGMSWKMVKMSAWTL